MNDSDSKSTQHLTPNIVISSPIRRKIDDRLKSHKNSRNISPARSVELKITANEFKISTVTNDEELLIVPISKTLNTTGNLLVHEMDNSRVENNKEQWFVADSIKYDNDSKMLTIYKKVNNNDADEVISQYNLDSHQEERSTVGIRTTGKNTPARGEILKKTNEKNNEKQPSSTNWLGYYQPMDSSGNIKQSLPAIKSQSGIETQSSQILKEDDNTFIPCLSKSNDVRLRTIDLGQNEKVNQIRHHTVNSEYKKELDTLNIETNAQNRSNVPIRNNFFIDKRNKSSPNRSELNRVNPSRNVLMKGMAKVGTLDTIEEKLNSTHGTLINNSNSHRILSSHQKNLNIGDNLYGNTLAVQNIKTRVIRCTSNSREPVISSKNSCIICKNDNAMKERSSTKNIRYSYRSPSRNHESLDNEYSQPRVSSKRIIRRSRKVIKHEEQPIKSAKKLYNII